MQKVAPLWLDTETFNLTDIRDGTDNYARTVEIMLWPFARGDRPAKLYDATAGAAMPAELEDSLLDERVPIIAHNATFDSTVLIRSGYDTPIERWRCTMAQALAHGLPGGLDKLCDIFGIDDDKAKLKDGKALVRLFCCPRPKNMKLRRATASTHPQDWERFCQYAVQDVEAMRAVYQRMPKWNYDCLTPMGFDPKGSVAEREMHLWHIDQHINMRGVTIDLDLVDGALKTAERVKSALADRAQEITDGEILATTQRSALLGHLNDHYGLELTDLRGSTVEKLLKSEAANILPPVVVELLENRLAASSTSVSKYKRFSQLTGPDGRLRNTLQFCGASRTGRWAGRGVQLQNLPRPTLKQKAIDRGIEDIKLGLAGLIHDNPMELLQSAVRGCIIAAPGKKKVVADLSNIEGRMLAWLAGEEWKLQAFRDFDTCLGVDGRWYTGAEITQAALARRPLALELDVKSEPIRKGHDLYSLAYAKAFNVTPEAVMDNKKRGDGSWRQIGKVMELALGYQGGAGAFVTFALAYGIDLDAMAAQALPNIPNRVLQDAEGGWEWAVKKKMTRGLSKPTFLVCDSFKRLWREAHPRIALFWPALEDAFRHALFYAGKVFVASKVKVARTDSWVQMLLPSGRRLCYPSPKVSDDGKLSYMGVNQFTRQWCRIKTYAGKLSENATQAAARDVIAASLPEIELSGYEVESLVHDEDITDAPDTREFSSDHLAALMADNPVWAGGLPLAAAGFEAYRYRKD